RCLGEDWQPTSSPFRVLRTSRLRGPWTPGKPAAEVFLLGLNLVFVVVDKFHLPLRAASMMAADMGFTEQEESPDCLEHIAVLWVKRPAVVYRFYLFRVKRNPNAMLFIA